MDDAKQRPSLRALLSWALFDWANSAFSSIIQTFVFAAYLARQVASDTRVGTAEWGAAISLAGVFVALGSPMLGAIADQSGHRKRWILGFACLCVLATALLWFIKPHPSYVTPAIILVAIGTIGSEFAFVFYSAMLPSLAPPDQIGRWSGWGWGMGYAGGTIALSLSLVLFVFHGGSWLGLDTATGEPVRATCLFTAAWILTFTIPFFLFTPDYSTGNKPMRQAARDGFRQLWQTLRHIRQYKQIVRFLIAYLCYYEGLTTLFAFGGVFAATLFNMGEQEVMLFGISLNMVGGAGAALFALVDDRLGSKKTIQLALAGLILTAICTLLAPTKTLFWVFGLTVGIFVGPVQASTRAFMARAAPEHLRTEMFGFLAFSGKATSFIGPAIVGWLTYTTGNQRLGMSPVVVLLLLGAIMMFWVPPDDGRAAQHD